MKIKQFISGRWPGLKALALCAMAATAFVACKDDETDVVRDPHITLSEDAFLYNAAGETHSFTVYSNIDWKVEMADTSQTWVNIWPKEGSDDGVFAVKVSKQPSKDPVLREARFRVVGKHEHDNIIQEITISQRDVDPAAYLAEIAQKGHIKQQVLHNGNDLLARYKGTEENATGKSLSPDAWMKKLLSSEDSGVGLSGCSDPVVEMAMTAFTSLMLLATQIDSKNKEEQKAAISEAMDSRRIDLKALLPGMKNCDLTVGENGRAVLQADNGSVQVSRELASAELSRLSVTLNDSSLSEEAKRLRVTGVLNTVILSEAASQNFERGMSEQRAQSENLKR